MLCMLQYSLERAHDFEIVISKVFEDFFCVSLPLSIASWFGIDGLLGSVPRKSCEVHFHWLSEVGMKIMFSIKEAIG